MQQKDHGEELKSSRKHIEHKDIFAEQGQFGKVSCGSDQIEARPHVIEGGKHCRETGQ